MHTPILDLSSSPRTTPVSRPRRKRTLGPVLAAILACGVAAGATFVAAPAFAQTAPKFAVIDMRRAISETEEGLRVQANLKRLLDSRQSELETKTRQLQTDKEALEKKAQGGKVSKEVLQKEYEKLLQQDADIQRLQLEMQREMQRKEQEMTLPIVQRIYEVVKRIAAQEGYEMVFEKSAVPYFRTDLELTDRAIQMYNGGAGAPAKGAPPAKTPAAPAPAKPAAPAPAPKK